MPKQATILTVDGDPVTLTRIVDILKIFSDIPITATNGVSALQTT